MIIYDISRELFSAPVYPGDPAPQIQKIKGFEFGDIYNLSALYACTHTGTHIDAPLHFFDDGGDVASIPLEKCMGNAAVITLPAGPITGEVVERYFPRYISKVILRTQPDNVFFGGAAEDIADVVAAHAADGHHVARLVRHAVEAVRLQKVKAVRQPGQRHVLPGVLQRPRPQVTGQGAIDHAALHQLDGQIAVIAAHVDEPRALRTHVRAQRKARRQPDLK